MGMAASQARYVQLTARKTNVEFQGQQINQQRTSLASESAGLFTQLMDLQVPTAPSTSDYSTVEYTFNDGINNYTISNITNLNPPVDGFNAQVSYYYTINTYKGIGRTRTDLGVNHVNGEYWLTNGQGLNMIKLAQCNNDPDSDDYHEDYNAILQVCRDNPDSTLINTCGYDPGTQTLANIDGAYKYTSNGVTYYYSTTDLDNAALQGGAPTALTGYYAANIDENIDITTNAILESVESGRYSNITLEGDSTAFDLSTTTTTDSNAYNDAMNEYAYKQDLYQKNVNDINGKTSSIQQEDRILELKLKQLDTEQKALSTELDSVKKVIDKNIEQTYKTFQ